MLGQTPRGCTRTQALGFEQSQKSVPFVQPPPVVGQYPAILRSDRVTRGLYARAGVAAPKATTSESAASESTLLRVRPEATQRELG